MEYIIINSLTDLYIHFDATRYPWMSLNVFLRVAYCVDELESLRHHRGMTKHSRKRVALNKLTLTKRAVEAMQPTDKPWIAWDDRLTGFGIKVHPTGAKSFIVNYRAGDGGRKAPNRRVVLGPVRENVTRAGAASGTGRCWGKSRAAATRRASAPKSAACLSWSRRSKTTWRPNPTGPKSTIKVYRADFRLHLGDWRARPLDSITRRDVEARFNRLTEESGWSRANQSIQALALDLSPALRRYRGVTQPGRFVACRRGQVSSHGAAQESPPRRRYCPAGGRAGIEAEVLTPAARDAFWFGLYTGMRVNEVLPLRWEHVDMAGLVFRVEETKTGAPLELPITRQLAAILERRWVQSGSHPDGWVFPSLTSGSGRIAALSHLYAPISKAGGATFWYHALRNCFITVAERELMLPSSMTKRLVNHTRPNDVTQGYAADWTIGQLREPAQRIADRIEALMNPDDTDAAQSLAATEAQLSATGIPAQPVA